MTENVQKRIKIPLGIDVLSATKLRIKKVFDVFDRITLSFSGGKDSTVMFHLVADEARRRGRKFSVLFIDWEVQYHSTITHVAEMRELYTDCTEDFYWICLPLTTVNGVSAIQPEWIAWERNADWIRNPPDGAITDYEHFPFYQYGMTFESFIPAFNKWFSAGEPSAIMVGIRTD
ncbi:TPA: phosphoadenosine phosphosulfate reductase family protein, partial [Salmonella enterica subsp. enterica serovar Paratyphi B]|nr:phosphoadenosine phosphosulfate reductase family protein [Salmonella enterica subsp. enterica serovar Paratyphi B]